MNCYRFSIIIVTWNALHHLKNFLPSVTNTDYPNFEIIIADNASNDGTKDWVENNYPQVRHVTLEQNYGYCGGNNRTVPHATGDVLVFLNNDVEVSPNWLHPLNALFQNNPGAAAAQPKLLSYSNRDEFDYAGAAGGFIDKYGYPFCRGRLFDSLEKDNQQFETTGPVFWASGASMAVRRSVFKETGGFDEDFEFHMEEIDLCWRMQNLGHAVYYVPESKVYHLGGGSLQTGSPRKITYNFRNNLIMLWKNEETSILWARLPVRILLDFLAGLKFLVTLHFREFGAVIKAYIQFLGMLPLIGKKRSELAGSRFEKRKLAGRIPVSIVWQYYVRGKRRFVDLPHVEKYL